MKNLTPVQKENTKTILSSLENYGLGDIKKSLRQDMLIATFILCVCFIEAMVQIKYFKLKKAKRVKGEAAKMWNDFVNLYFPPEYKDMGESLCENLRHRIVHNYSGNRVYALGEYSAGGKITHLRKFSTGEIFLSVNSFVIAVDSAFYKFKHDLLTNHTMQLAALERLKQDSILS